MELGQINYRYFSTWLKLKVKGMKSGLTKQHGNYSKFIILCSPRTGSTLLHTYLNSHPNINSLGEILRKQKENNRFLNTSPFKLTGANIEAVGLKYFYSYQKEKSYSIISNELIIDKSIKVIHLIRKDVKAQFKSLKIAETTGQWNSHKKNILAEKIEVEVVALDQFKLELESQQKVVVDKFSEHSMLTVTYEDLTEDSEKVLGNVQRFLDVKVRLLSSLLVKQS